MESALSVLTMNQILRSLLIPGKNTEGTEMPYCVPSSLRNETIMVLEGGLLEGHGKNKSSSLSSVESTDKYPKLINDTPQ